MIMHDKANNCKINNNIYKCIYIIIKQILVFAVETAVALFAVLNQILVARIVSQ